jgi:drug/metabolite transporter (DMT)-like permease
MHTPSRYTAPGLFWALTSALLWSTTYIVIRALTPYGVDGLTLSAIRFVLGALVLLIPALTVFRRPFLAVPPRDRAILAVLSLFGIGGMSVLLFVGQAGTSAINGALIMQVSPVLMLLLAAALGERIRPMQTGGILLALVGSLLIGEVWRMHGHWRGDILIMLSAACWAVYSVLGRGVVARHGGFIATAWAMLFGMAFLVAARLLLPVVAPGIALTWPVADPRLWSYLLYLGIFPSGVAFVAWYESLHRLPFSLANAFQYLTPAATILLAWGILDEQLTLVHLTGIAVLAMGIWLASRHDRA